MDRLGRSRGAAAERRRDHGTRGASPACEVRGEGEGTLRLAASCLAVLAAVTPAVLMAEAPGDGTPVPDDGPLGTRDLPGPWPDGDGDGAWAAFGSWSTWEMLYARAQAFERLARSGHPKSLDQLLARIGRPRAPFAEEERQLLAGALRHLRGKVDPGRALDLLDRKEPAWLRYQVDHLVAAHDGPSALLTSAAKRPLRDRALALQAAAHHGDLEVSRNAASALLAEGLARGVSAVDERLAIGACAEALLVLSRRGADVAPAVLALVDALDTDLEVDTRRLLARYLRELIGGEEAWQASAPWRTHLAGEAALSPAPGPGATRVRAPVFMGTRLRSGARVVYVIDLSDSMLTPWTGNGGARTRLDAVRAQLGQSLTELEPTACFAVVAFGDEAALLASTPKLVRATPRAVQATINELAAMTPGAATTARPHGTLRGETNLHAALRLAFRTTTRGLVAEAEAVEEKVAVDVGADAIFVLSDGEPNRDGFLGRSALVTYPAQPPRKGGYRDPETGAWIDHDTPGNPAYDTRYEWYGPYRVLEYFALDLERMNLLRKVEVHAIGIGESDLTWLRACAAAGLGTTRTSSP